LPSPWSRRSPARAFAHDDAFEGTEQHLIAYPGESQRTPRRPELDTERRLLGRVPADVADEHRDAVRAGLHRVVEVAAEQPELAAGAVDVPMAIAASSMSGRGSRPCSSRADSAWCSSTSAEAHGAVLGGAALHRVPDGALQQHAVHPALDQVVLGAVGERGRAQVLVGQGRSARTPPPASGRQQFAERGDAGRVGSSRSSTTQSTPASNGFASAMVGTTVSTTGAWTSSSSSRTRNASPPSSSTRSTRIWRLRPASTPAILP